MSTNKVVTQGCAIEYFEIKNKTVGNVLPTIDGSGGGGSPSPSPPLHHPLCTSLPFMSCLNFTNQST